MLEALLLLQKRAPIDFSICAFTVEQGKFLSSIAPIGEYLKGRGIDWTYFRDEPSMRLLEEQPGHAVGVGLQALDPVSLREPAGQPVDHRTGNVRGDDQQCVAIRG